eukprot:TRINITY_DN6835_c0_g1_i3.p1 TRINITY_DN6835_c0_g1~~TRINITY_DN6835_c0_g1_i3.p1  ORF type:complete len:153 (-),score=25.88 TRINITY_DN6835_c0_g1_i3:250-708(-)
MINLCSETWRVAKELELSVKEPAPRAEKRKSRPTTQHAAAKVVSTQGVEKPSGSRAKRRSDVVWARMQGHPWWPAKLFPEAEQTEAKQKYVFFFGTGQWGLLPESAVQPFDGDLVKFAPKKNLEAWKRAVADATQTWTTPPTPTSSTKSRKK